MRIHSVWPATYDLAWNITLQRQRAGYAEQVPVHSFSAGVWLAVMTFHTLLLLPIRSFTMQGIQNVAFEQSRQTRRDLQR